MARIPRGISKARSETQADKAIRFCQEAGVLRSVGTNRNYRDCLKVVCDYIREHHLGDLMHITEKAAVRYLEAKAGTYSQSTLDMHRQSIQALMKARGDLPKDGNLPVVKAVVPEKIVSKHYTPEQVSMVAAAQNGRNGFSTRLAYACGLRAHEIPTIHRIGEGKAVDLRYYADGTLKALPEKWEGLPDGERYAVTGKGGLTREIHVPADLARELESRRFDEPRTITDRGVLYRDVRYDVAGGQAWSTSFSKASNRVLGWSTGAHSLRHSYAQARMDELQKRHGYDYSREVVAQELGHFRSSTTDTYIKG